MNFLILIDKIETELDHQALDYYQLLGASIEPTEEQSIVEQVGAPRTIELAKARNLNILAFKPLRPADVKAIHSSNRLFIFSTGSLAPSTILVANAAHAFITFGSRSAFKLANTLKAMNINRPVHRLRPWVDISGIKQYESPPFGRVNSTEDIGLRSVFRLMAARAVVIVPNIDPFNNMITDGWNGIVFEGTMDELDQQKFGDLKETVDAKIVASRAEEHVRFLMDPDRYKKLMHHTLDSGSLDYNEPWIEVRVDTGSSWIIIKESVEDGNVVEIPSLYNQSFRRLRTITLRQLLEYMTNMRFNKVYVFDILTEPLDSQEIALINRSLTILGNRVHNILFCMDIVPEEWKAVASKLTFMSISEASKQVQ